LRIVGVEEEGKEGGVCGCRRGGGVREEEKKNDNGKKTNYI
jgi:hypothetical protein